MNPDNAAFANALNAMAPPNGWAHDGTDSDAEAMKRLRLCMHEIWRCAQAGHADRLRVLIVAAKAEFPSFVESQDYLLRRALAVGVCNNHDAAVSVLLAEGADPLGYTPWHTDDGMVQTLVRAARAGSTRFKNDLNKARIWSSMAGAQSKSVAFALHTIMDKEYPEKGGAFAEGFASSFQNACLRDNGPRFHAVAALLQCKADVDGVVAPFYKTPLHAACNNPCRPRIDRLVTMLLRAKADANVQTDGNTINTKPRDYLLQEYSQQEYPDRRYQRQHQDCLPWVRRAVLRADRLLVDAERGIYPASTTTSKTATTSKAKATTTSKVKAATTS
jgi:hypothetical protein